MTRRNEASARWQRCIEQEMRASNSRSDSGDEGIQSAKHKATKLWSENWDEATKIKYKDNEAQHWGRDTNTEACIENSKQKKCIRGGRDKHRIMMCSSVACWAKHNVKALANVGCPEEMNQHKFTQSSVRYPDGWPWALHHRETSISSLLKRSLRDNIVASSFLQQNKELVLGFPYCIKSAHDGVLHDEWQEQNSYSAPVLCLRCLASMHWYLPNY